MVLLTVIAVGLLSLSSISLRSSSQGDAMQAARSNARLALTLAIGQLQKSAGADQRVTAPASIVKDTAPAWLTGVWSGQLPSSDNPVPDKSATFEGYLLSGQENATSNAPSDVPETDGGTLLLGEGSLGKNATPADSVRAAKINTVGRTGAPDGRYAWSVLDEGVKAKVDLVREENREIADAWNQSSMGAPARLGIENISSLQDYDWFGGEDQRRMFTLSTAAVMEDIPDLKALQHQVTTVHRGLLTDSARGGLRKDLSRLFDNNRLPGEFSSGRIYDDGKTLEEEPNPYWSQLFDFANQYQNLTQNNGSPMVKAVVPAGYNPVYLDRPTRSYKTAPKAPRGQLIMPVVAKVQMMFSLVVQDAHGPWSGGSDGSTTTQPDNFMVYMIYSPIITLYNPYNVALSFDEMRLDFKDLPVGFRFYLNGRPQTTRMAHLNQLYVDDQANASNPKTFGINLRSAFTPGRAAPMIMQPGETIVFGESVNGNGTWEDAFDWRNDNLTQDIVLAPGYPSSGIGYWIDWLTPETMLAATDSDKVGIFSLRRDSDSVDVEFAPMASTASSGTNLSIEVSLKRGSRPLRSGSLDLEYGGTSTLTDALNHDPNNSFPGGGRGLRLQRPYSGRELYQRPGTKLKDYTGPKYFALFSYYGKTTLDSDTPAKPWISGCQSGSLSAIDLTNEGPGVHPFEIAFKRVAPGVKFPIDAQNRGKFFTGHSEVNGTRIAPQYEIPQLPLQNIAQLRHAGLANQGFLPGATYTAGESFAPAMMAQEDVVSPGPKDYLLFDHAWLANNALWDSYFFSTLSPYSGPLLGSSHDAKTLAENLFRGTEKLLNPRIVPSGGSPSSEQMEEIIGDEGYLHSAAHLMIDGAFNVNSTSEEAWKALLSSLNKQDVDFFHIADGAPIGEDGTVEEVSNPFSRMRRANGQPVENANMLQARHARWTGMRSLTDDQIEDLARYIVEEIRERGPFLSIAEFVNRAPGGNKQHALSGALQAAIDRTESINERFSADSRYYTADDLQDSGYAFLEAMEGMNAAGAPGYLTQGDILSSIGASIAVRSDTFRIRGYGETLDQDQKVTAKAWCEAVVQRVPEFIDPEDAPEAEISSLNETNTRFGRRFVITSFRWLSPEEV